MMQFAKYLFLLVVLLVPVQAWAAFTEFYVQTTADNLNAGSTNADAAAQTYAGGTFVRATGVFTVASGDPVADGVAVGDFASIYTTAGATVATFVARVTARTTTTITVSLTAIAGSTSSVSETAAATTCKVGGAWKGPNAAVMFPFNFLVGTLTNSAGDFPCANFKNGVTYNITSAMTHSLTGPARFEGYTTTLHDGGKILIDNNATAASFTILTVSGGSNELVNVRVTMSGASSGSGDGIAWTATSGLVSGCVAFTCRKAGFLVSGTNSTALLLECEAYDCNKNNSSSSHGGIHLSAPGSTFKRCISHNHNPSTAARGVGFLLESATLLVECISESNAGDGFNVTAAMKMYGCDAYNNGGDGLEFINGGSSHQVYVVENSNFVKNGGYGINGSGSAGRAGFLSNCGFGSGTQANTSGTTTGLKAMIEQGTVTYATDVTPWVDPANGDFRINLSTAKNTGRGTFTQTQASYAGAVGYPDIGSNQHQDAGGGTTVAGGLFGALQPPRTLNRLIALAIGTAIAPSSPTVSLPQRSHSGEEISATYQLLQK